MKVNIYTDTTAKGPGRRKEAAGIYIVEFVLKTGEPITRKGIVWQQDTTENEMTLTLIYFALKTLTKSCLILINTSCPHVLNVMNNNWLGTWKKDNFQKNGRPRANAGLWRSISSILDDMKGYVVTDQEHSYKSNMKYELSKVTGKDYKPIEECNCVTLKENGVEKGVIWRIKS